MPKRITEKLIADVRRVITLRGIRVRIYRGEKPYSGYYDGTKKLICLSSYGLDAREFLSTAYHELGHAVQHRQGLGVAYHIGFKPGYKHFRKWATAAVPSEYIADILGRKWMKLDYPGVRFSPQSGKWGFIHRRVEMIGREKFPGRKCPLCGRVMR